MGWAGNRVSPQITATPRFPVGSRVLLKPADPKGRKKGMFVDCAGVVISVQETTTKYALRKLWRGGAGAAGLRLLRQDRWRRICYSRRDGSTSLLGRRRAAH